MGKGVEGGAPLQWGRIMEARCNTFLSGETDIFEPICLPAPSASTTNRITSNTCRPHLHLPC